MASSGMKFRGSGLGDRQAGLGFTAHRGHATSRGGRGGGFESLECMYVCQEQV